MASKPETTTTGIQASLPKVLGQTILSFRARYRQKWAAYLRENYRSPEEVAVAHGVRYQTALNWWHGTNSPMGYAVSLAHQRHPESASRHLSPDP